MAQTGVLLVRLRTLCNIAKCVHTGGKTASNWRGEMRWYTSKARRFHEYGPLHVQTEGGNASSNLLKEFPDPKGLLYNTISRSLGVSDLSHLIQYSCTEHAGVKRATVTVLWPCKIEEEGQASKKVDAERSAAAAVCLKLREMGFIGPNNELPRRRSGRGRHSSLHDHEDDLDLHTDMTQGDTSNISEALSLFPQPRSLLTRVIQLATSSNRTREQMQFRTTKGKLKSCELTLHWPEEMTFSATARSRVTAERMTAALACMKLKELNLLDKNNNPLTHAMYHREQVMEAGKRERRPLPLEIPQFLEEQMREYLAQVHVHLCGHKEIVFQLQWPKQSTDIKRIKRLWEELEC